ncbi:MAG: S8/S53 family peptidase [Polyangiaceae bacterium]
MNLRTPLFLSGILSLVACTPPPPECPPPPATPAPAAASYLCNAAPDACLAGIPGNGGVWTGRPLLPEGAASPPSLAGKCGFFWSSETGAAPDQQALTKASAACVADPFVVGPMAPLPAAVQAFYRDRFREQLGALASLPTAVSPAPVHIAVVDAAPFSDGTIDPNSHPHGFNVAWIAKQLPCPDPQAPCSARISTHLALPFDLSPTGVTYNAKGGTFGTRATTATAILQAVSTWQSQGGKAPLVIVLGLGWGPANGCHPEHPLSREVFDALSYARCQGALLVTAAGNNAGWAQPPDGPTCPAVWEEEPAPDAARCQSLGVSTPRGLPPQGTRAPLLHAIGGVDYNDTPISVSRPHSLPPLVTLAQHGIAYHPPASERSLAFTGTSVAAAAAAGAAALVWSYRPDLPPHELMSLLHDTAVPLPSLTANVCIEGAPCPPVHRLSICAAVAKACPTCALSCPTRPPTDNPRMTPQLSAALTATLAGPPTTRRAPRAPAWLSSFVFPQPGVPCPACAFFLSTGRFDGIIDPDYRGEDLTNMTVELFDAAGNRLTPTFPDLPTSPFLPGASFSTVLSGFPSTTARANVTWTTPSGTITQGVLVSQ